MDILPFGMNGIKEEADEKPIDMFTRTDALQNSPQTSISSTQPTLSA